MTRYFKTTRLAAAILWAGVVVAQQPPQVVPTRPQLLHPLFQGLYDESGCAPAPSR